MKKKLIALDIDGTLVRGGNPLSPKAKDILSRLVKEGHEIVFASGRPVRAILPYYESVGCKSPMIAYNGLWVHRPEQLGKKPGYSFKKEDIQEIYDKVKDRLIAFMAESETNIYSSVHEGYLDIFFPYKGMNEITNPNVEIKEDVLTVLFRADPEDDPYIEEVVNSYEGYGYRHWTNSPYSEMYRIGHNKGSGLKLIQEALGFEKDDIIAIGDSDNDMEMLELAGHPFAVKGCKSKQLTDIFPVTDYPLEEDGAVLMLEKLLLK